MYKFLKGEMVKKSITVNTLAKRLGLSEKTIRNKINGATEFTWSEIQKTREYVAPDMDIEELFQKETPDQEVS